MINEKTGIESKYLIREQIEWSLPHKKKMTYDNGAIFTNFSGRFRTKCYNQIVINLLKIMRKQR